MKQYKLAPIEADTELELTLALMSSLETELPKGTSRLLLDEEDEISVYNFRNYLRRMRKILAFYYYQKQMENAIIKPEKDRG